MSERPLSGIFKAYDIRGLVPEQLDSATARAIGAAFARFTGAPRILLVRDMRPSGVELAAAFAEGARGHGATIVDLGLASTDFCYFASGKLDCPGAMFTASHNPAGYNGIKLCLAGARPIGRDTGLDEIERLTDESLRASAAAPTSGGPGPSLKGGLEEADLLEEYAEHVRSFVDRSVLRPLRVVADTANGMGGLVVPLVMKGLPFDVEILYPELDGTFPNHPADPIQEENLADLKAAVLDRGADIGLAFDGDADRVFLVDERAESVSGSTTTALVAAALLERNPGATVLYNLICSRAVPEIIAEHGGVPLRTRVGHSYIKETMAETGAIFGGEHSGHYYFRDNYRADSGIIAALLALEVLSKSSTSLSHLLVPYQRYAASGEINTEVPDPPLATRLVADHEAAAGSSVDHLDGITVDRGDWWYNLRPSNTEPLLRLNVEAPDAAACAAHVAEIQSLVSSLLADRKDHP